MIDRQVYSEPGINEPPRPGIDRSESVRIGTRFWKFARFWTRTSGPVLDFENLIDPGPEMFPGNFEPEIQNSSQYCRNDDRYCMLYIGPLILNSYYCSNEFFFYNLNYCFRYDGVSKLLSDQKSFFFRSSSLFRWYARWNFLF